MKIIKNIKKKIQAVTGANPAEDVNAAITEAKPMASPAAMGYKGQGKNQQVGTESVGAMPAKPVAKPALNVIKNGVNKGSRILRRMFRKKAGY